MRRKFIGSSGALVPFRCQNDIFLTDCNPLAPIVGDRRVIFQDATYLWGLVYFEEYVAGGFWQVRPLGGFTLLNTTLGVQLPRRFIPFGYLTNDKVAHFMFPGWTVAYVVCWGPYHYELSQLAGEMKYVKHAKRRPDQLYLQPEVNPDAVEYFNVLHWSVQVNLCRSIEQ